MKKSTPLKNTSEQEFFSEYWQKKPLLIRQAFPDFKPLLSKEDLFKLASKDDVESRLISQEGRNWHMQNGPFAKLPSPAKKAWTLLVQGVNLHNDGADRLLQQFRFIPDARLDDLMISYATDTGGVGPHFDSYDVFLLQAQGQRRWRISAQKDLSLKKEMPLKILQNFKAEQEFVLEPGDTLYLPPQYAHDGTAIGECMTYSIGFRAPSYQELGDAFLQFMADSIDLPGHYSDPDLKPVKHPAEINRLMLTKVAAELSKVRFTSEDFTIFLGGYLSEPKANIYFDPPEKFLTLKAFEKLAGKYGVALSRRTRMLYRGEHVFINGESFVARDCDKASLTALANIRELDGGAIKCASKDVVEALHTWYADGWLHLIQTST